MARWSLQLFSVFQVSNAYYDFSLDDMYSFHVSQTNLRLASRSRHRRDAEAQTSNNANPGTVYHTDTFEGPQRYRQYIVSPHSVPNEIGMFNLEAEESSCPPG